MSQARFAGAYFPMNTLESCAEIGLGVGWIACEERSMMAKWEQEIKRKFSEKRPEG